MSQGNGASIRIDFIVVASFSPASHRRSDSMSITASIDLGRNDEIQNYVFKLQPQYCQQSIEAVQGFTEIKRLCERETERKKEGD